MPAFAPAHLLSPLRILFALGVSLVVLFLQVLVLGVRTLWVYSEGSARKSRARRILMKEMAGRGMPRPLVKKIAGNYAPSSRDILVMAKSLSMTGTRTWRKR